MQFEREGLEFRGGEKAGYTLAYILFSTCLFFMLSFTHKLPSSWTFLHVAAMTFSITLLAFLVRRWLQ